MNSSDMQRKPRLVILGSGFGAFSLLKNIDAAHYRVTVVSPRNHFLFTPLLVSTTVGTIEFRSIIEPVRTAREGVVYHQAWCTGIDPGEQSVTCQSALDGNQFMLAYDFLVIAVGSVSDTFDTPGVHEYALFIKDLSDARAIRQKIIECFEKASAPDIDVEKKKHMLNFVVVGGGPTGVEIAAEIHDFLRDDVRKWYPDLARLARIVLLEAMETILSSFDKKLSEYTAKFFARENIAIRTKSPVIKITKHAIILKDETEIPFGIVIWSAGNGATPLVEKATLPKDNRNRVIIDEYTRVKGYETVFALGDCSVMDGRELPETAQVAQQQGIYLAKELNRRAEGKCARQFLYEHSGMLAYIGSRRALIDLPHIKTYGMAAWLFWRSAYLTKLVSWKNKILVLFDWFKTSVFGRDISRF